MFNADEALPFPSDTMSGGRIILPCLPSPGRGIAGVRQMTCISRLPCCFRNELDSPTSAVQAHGVTKHKAPPSNDQDDSQHVTHKVNEDGDANADGDASADCHDCTGKDP
jgi:hypothetical protein